MNINYSNEQEWIECNAGSFEVLGAFGSLSFGKFTILSSVAGNQVWVNHLTRLQQPMSDPTNEPSRKPRCESTNDRMFNDQTTNQRLEWDAELPNVLSQKQGKYSLSQKQDAEFPNKITISITQVSSDTFYKFEAVYGVNHDHDKSIVNKQVTFSDERDNEIHSKSPTMSNVDVTKRVTFRDERDNEIHSEIPTMSNSRPNEWRMPDKINLDSSGLRGSARSAVLRRREKVYSHSTTVLKSV